MATLDLLSQYKAMRDFLVTPEPADTDTATDKASRNGLTFVVHKHWASSLHYDFRLELGGTLKSWAVPKGPSLDPTDKRLAVQVEDHPLSYAGFEGTIPAQQYGAGRVIVWDKGQWQPLGDPVQGLKDGSLKFELRGHKLAGRWALVRMKSRDGKEPKQPPWLLIKEKDPHAQAVGDFNVTVALPDSVASIPPAQTLQPLQPLQPAQPPAPVRATERRVTARQTSRKGSAEPRAAHPGAVKARLPARLPPQLATLKDQAPSEAGDWLYEVKLDGYRLLTRVQGASVQVFTRQGHDWSAKLGPLVEALKRCQWPTGWYDGELVVLNANGVPDFGALQAAL